MASPTTTSAPTSSAWRSSPAQRAEKKLEFIEHPLWRTYTFVYTEGTALLERWLAGVPADAQADRFRRLLVEQVTPSGIAAEIAAEAARGAAGGVPPLVERASPG